MTDKQLVISLYKLTRQRGKTLAVYKQKSAPVTDYKTGKQNVLYDVSIINKALVLDSRDVRAFSYDTSYLAVNKNFAIGGFFDTAERTVIFSKKGLDFVINQNCFIIFESRKYEIIDMSVTIEDYGYILRCKEVKNVKPFDTDSRAFFDSGWSGSDKTKYAIDALINGIKYSVFDGTIPSSLMLWACCGNNLTDALQCVYHPSAIGTSLINSGFIESDYIERGVNGGLKGDGSSYLTTSYNIETQLNWNDCSICIYTSNESEDQEAGITGAWSTDDEQLSVRRNGQIVSGYTAHGTNIVSWSESNGGTYFLNSATNLEAYKDGVLVETESGARGTVLPSINLSVFRVNDSGNICTDQIRTIMIGPKLTSQKVLLASNLIAAFNSRLGRLI